MTSFLHFVIPLASAILFIAFLFKWIFSRASTAREGLPPSPPKLPVIGNLHQLGLFPHVSLRELSKRYGPLMMLHLGQVPAIVVSSAEAACEVLKTQDLIFSNRPKLSFIEKITYGSKDIAFAPYGEHWRQVRSICVLHLLSNKRVQSFCHIREEETDLLIEKIRRSSSSPSSVTNLSYLLVSATNDTISRVALGRKYSDGEAEGRRYKFELLLKETAELAGTFNVGDFIPWLKWLNKFNSLDARVDKVAKSFDEFLSGVVEEHKNKKQGMTGGNNNTSEADLVDILLEIQREKSGSALDDEAIKAVILDIFVAGTDTTSTTLEWTLAEVLRNQEILQKLQNEVRQVVGSKLKVLEEDLEKMPYLKAVIKEGLRLHPPVPLLIPRESTQDTIVMGFRVAAGTQVFINVGAIARDPKQWENPEEFIPERFLENMDKDFKGFNFEYIPFGAGRRGCPGIAFAMAVDELVLAKLMLNFDFALPKGVDMDMTEATGNTIHKKNPILVVATPRFF